MVAVKISHDCWPGFPMTLAALTVESVAGMPKPGPTSATGVTGDLTEPRPVSDAMTRAFTGVASNQSWST
jgi:hypothetical protein